MAQEANQSSSQEILLDNEDLQEVNAQLAGLSEKVKSGAYLLHAEKGAAPKEAMAGDFHEHYPHSYTVVVIKPSGQNQNAPITSMTFNFDYIDRNSVTFVDFTIGKADGKTLVYKSGRFGHSHEKIARFLKEAHDLGRDKIRDDEDAIRLKAQEERTAAITHSISLGSKAVTKSLSSQFASPAVVMSRVDLVTLDKLLKELPEKIKSGDFTLDANVKLQHSKAFDKKILCLEVIVKPSDNNSNALIKSMAFKFHGENGMASPMVDFTIWTADGKVFTYDGSMGPSCRFLPVVRGRGNKKIDDERIAAAQAAKNEKAAAISSLKL